MRGYQQPDRFLRLVITEPEPDVGVILLNDVGEYQFECCDKIELRHGATCIAIFNNDNVLTHAGIFRNDSYLDWL